MQFSDISSDGTPPSPSLRSESAPRPDIELLHLDSVPSEPSGASSPEPAGPPPLTTFATSQPSPDFTNDPPNVPALLADHSEAAIDPEGPRFRSTTDYKHLAQAIKKLQKKVGSKQSGLSSEAMKNTLVDLEALDQYTALAKKLQERLDTHNMKLQNSRPAMRRILRKKAPKIKPMQTASETVAARFGKGPWFARRLRFMASHILRTGELPQSKRGKGAHHQSAFNEPEIRAGIDKWLKGLVPIGKGGYDGQVSLLSLLVDAPLIIQCSCGLQSCAATSTTISFRHFKSRTQ